MTQPTTTPDNTLFDEHGRRIPAQLTQPANRLSRRYFRIEQPPVDFGQIHSRISRHLGQARDLDADQFERRATAIARQIEGDPTLRAMLNGVHVPFFLPRQQDADIGQAMAERFIPAVGAAYVESFPERSFTDHSKEELAGAFQTCAESRHLKLIERMTTEDVVGLYFPCLSEFSLPATREQMSSLPECMLLAGGYDTCAALTGSPELLHRKTGYPNLLWLAALDTADPNVNHYFEAYGLNLTYNKRSHFGQVSEYWCSALVVLG